MKKRLVIGLTGPMAAGKNIAAQFFAEKGYAVTDADIVAHEALNVCKKSVLERFTPEAEKAGIQLKNPDGSINRRQLGSFVFSSKKRLAALESILHPVIDQMLFDFINAHTEKNVVINAIVLYKSQVIHTCDFLLYISAPFFTRFRRVRHRDGLSGKKILVRFFAQRRLYAKHLKNPVDIYRVENNSTPDILNERLSAILKTYQAGG